MFSLIDKIKHGKLWNFHGGIHPSIKKVAKKIDSLANASLPNELVIPVLQHIGSQGELLICVGDHVFKGQALTQSSNPMSPPVHASTSGYVSMIEKRPSMHPAVIDELCIIIKPDGLDTPIVKAPDSLLSELSKQEISQKIHQAGITGMGGAGFPSAIKSTLNDSKTINYLIINGAECEPFIQADDALMQVKAREIIEGIQVLAKLLKPELILFAIEDDKNFAISAITNSITSNIQLRVIPTLYPSGGERQLIKLLTGMEVPSGGLPADIGVIVHNVGTCYAIKRATLNNEALTERVLTLAGEGFNEAQNLIVKIGTPVHNLLKAYSKGMTASRSKLIIGGPMMGFTLPHAQIPVTKTCNAILLDSNEKLAHSQDPLPCIRCGQCADACPSNLLPQSMYWHAKAGELDKTQQLNVMDCIECGACDYVCPSKIPLVLYFRQSKAQLRQQQQETQAASLAKSRFDFREIRLDRDKFERAEKHKAAAEKRLAMMEAHKKEQQQEQDSNQDAAAKKPDPIAAAIARARAKKATSEAASTSSVSSNTTQPVLTESQAKERSEQRALRKEQARQYKAEKQQDNVASSVSNENKTQQEPVAKTVNPAVAAAIARAKAKKAAQLEPNQPSITSSPDPLESQQLEQDKPKQNPAVTAAIARAKAKKAAQLEPNDPSITSSCDPLESQQLDQDKSKQYPTFAAAISRAKDKKPASQTSYNQELPPAATLSDNTNTEQAEPTKPKQNPAVAAAIARAKAKKAVQNKGKE